MNPNALRYLILLALCMGAAVLFGTILASGNFEFLVLLAYAALGIYLLAAPGLIPLLAIGLLSPFTLPVPFIHSFPFLLLILSLCCVKLFFWRAVSSGEQLSVRYRHCLTLSIVVFFGWVVMRYSVNPVLPNLTGFGQNVTGFRAYLDYGLCGFLLVLLPMFVMDRYDVQRLIKWICGISLFFILFLTPLVFTKNFTVALWLERFGLFVSTYDNGWLRFVVLPVFGQFLISAAMLPALLSITLRKRLLLGGLGSLGVLLGGSRSGLITAFIVVVVIVIIQRRFRLLSLLMISVLLFISIGNYIGERVSLHHGAGVLRVLSLTSRRIAEQTDAAANSEFRKIRWQRTVDEIRRNPIFGRGYGGLENAWVFSDFGNFSQAMIEVSVAAGTIHNGYLASAYALGIPGTGLFLIILSSQVLMNGLRGSRFQHSDPLLGELHMFLCANILAFAASIFIGADLNNSMLWCLFGLGVILKRIKYQEVSETQQESIESLPTGITPGWIPGKA